MFKSPRNQQSQVSSQRSVPVEASGDSSSKRVFSRKTESTRLPGPALVDSSARSLQQGPVSSGECALTTFHSVNPRPPLTSTPQPLPLASQTTTTVATRAPSLHHHPHLPRHRPTPSSCPPLRPSPCALPDRTPCRTTPALSARAGITATP